MAHPPSPTLLQLTLTAVGRNLDIFSPSILATSLPVSSLVDILHHVVTVECWSGEKETELIHTHIVTLFPLLLIPLNKRDKVHRLFQKVCEKELNKDEGTSDAVPLNYLPRRVANFITQSSCPKEGLLLGCFLFDAGWYSETTIVLSRIIKDPNVIPKFRLPALEKLLLAQSYCNLVTESGITYSNLVTLAKEEKEEGLNLARIYNTFSIYHYSENRYDKALRWSIAALKELDRFSAFSTATETCSEVLVTVVDILRQTATCCSVKRELVKAQLLINKALALAREGFGEKSVKYGEVLMDYGLYLISSDNVKQGVEVYTEAVQIRQDAFGTYNIHTALALTELAYSLYVQEYNTGQFDLARSYAEQAISVASRLLPREHLLQASSSRVLALILEEIAIDNVGSPSEGKLLVEAEALHLSCLQLTLGVFGEMNVQTAKHYGNLGRLYQTMKKYQDAEVMHMKAISIKERLLGEWDYEVALSVGHLASLYNYDLCLFHKAELLHLRSIAIGQALFGQAYSGLEYDYRGLLQVYLMTGREEKYGEYSRVLTNWKLLQDVKSAALAMGPNSQIKCHEPLESTLSQFHRLSWSQWKAEQQGTDIP